MKRIAGLLAALAALIAPSAAQAWDIKNAQIDVTCLSMRATIDANASNPRTGDFNFKRVVDGARQDFPFVYSPSRQSFQVPSGIPQDGKQHTITVALIDHDGDVVVPRTTTLTCGTPAAPPVPRTPPGTPPSPPVPPKVCVPSGGSVDLHKTGSRSFELIGRVHRIRWRFAGERFPSLNGQKSVTIPGAGTGRVVVRFRANCQSGKRVGQVLPAPPPATAGSVHMTSAPANTPPEVVAAAQKVADQWLREWNANLSNAPATKSRVRWCRVNLYRTEAPEWWNCRLRLKLSNGGHCSARTRVERFGDGTASPGPYKIRRCVL